MVKMIREGERGFWVWTDKKGWIFVVVAFILYSADMAEFTKATGSVQKKRKSLEGGVTGVIVKKATCLTLLIHSKPRR